MPSGPALWILDSSILIAYLRFGEYREFLSVGLKRETIFVPCVVLCELYAGATSRQDLADLEVLRKALGNHLLEVSAEDWVLAGRCLSFYARRWGKIRPRDHLVDSLVAVSALQIDAILASEDLHQLRRWSWVLGKLGRRLKVTSIVKR